jgi:hypothetical protein
LLIGTTTGTTSFGRTLNLYTDANTGTVASNAYLLVQSLNRNSVVEISGSASSTNALNFSNTPGTAVAGVVSSIADQNLFFRTGGTTERMRITSAGDVGIGTTTMTGKFNVGGSANPNIYSVSTGGISTVMSSVDVFGCSVIGSTSNHPVAFYSNNTERMRIDASGNLLIGTTSGTDFKLKVQRSGNQGLGAFINTDTSGITYDQMQVIVGQAASTAFHFLRFYTSAGATQQFAFRGDGTLFATNTTIQSISDVRTKENIVDSTDGLNVINALRPVRFDFKKGFGSEKKNQIGFIAQEIENVFSDAVDIWGESDDPKNPYKSVGTSALIPVLVKAIQELKSELDSIKAELQTLKGS